jgi:hypothetical protein
MPKQFETPFDALDFIKQWDYHSVEELEEAIREVVQSGQALLLSVMLNELQQYLLPVAADSFMLSAEPNELVTSDRFGHKLFIDIQTMSTRLDPGGK